MNNEGYEILKALLGCDDPKYQIGEDPREWDHGISTSIYYNKYLIGYVWFGTDANITLRSISNIKKTFNLYDKKVVEEMQKFVRGMAASSIGHDWRMKPENPNPWPKVMPEYGRNIDI